MLKILRSNFKYIFIFLFTIFVLVFFGVYTNNWDSLWNYGFSYSISKGQIPYNEFTMIIPPLYNYIMSIGLIIFSHNNIVFLIEQAILVTINFYLLYKLFNYKSWLLVLLMCFPMYLGFSPTYNYFIFFLFIILLYLERYKKNDYIAGFVLGLMLLTKYTVGIFFIIPSIIYYFKDKTKLLKRFIGLIIPVVIFIIYLLLTGSMYKFLDQCVFGLFDFGKSNSDLFNWYSLIATILFVISIIAVIKDKKNILNWYVVFSFSIMIPNFSCYHFYIYLLFIGLLLIEKINISKKDTLIFTFTIMFIITLIHSILLFNFKNNTFKIERYNNMNNFNYYINYKGSKNTFIKTNKLYKKLEKEGPTYFLSSSGDVWLKVVNEEKTNYFTILNRGNYGYDGLSKMKRRVNKMKNTYFIININNYKYSKTNKARVDQFDYELVKYIMDESKKIDSKYGYDIYYKE